MLIIMCVLGGLLGVLIWGFFDEILNADENQCIFAGIVIFFVSIVFIGFFDYEMSGNSNAEMEAKYANLITNSQKIAFNLNSISVVKYEKNQAQIFIDLANQGQSKVASKVIAEYLNEVNKFNVKLASRKYKMKEGVVKRAIYGFYRPFENDIKRIKIEFNKK